MNVVSAFLRYLPLKTLGMALMPFYSRGDDTVRRCMHRFPVELLLSFGGIGIKCGRVAEFLAKVAASH